MHIKGNEIGTDIKRQSNRHLPKNEYHAAQDHIIRYKVQAILRATYNTVVKLELEGTNYRTVPFRIFSFLCTCALHTAYSCPFS